MAFTYGPQTQQKQSPRPNSAAEDTPYGSPAAPGGQYTPPGSRYTYGGVGSGTTYNPSTNSWQDAYGNQTSFNASGGLQTITPQQLQGQSDIRAMGSLAGQQQQQARNLQMEAATQGLAAANPLGLGLQNTIANSVTNQRNAPTQQQLLSGSGYGYGGGLGSGLAYPSIQPVQAPSTTAYDNAAFGAAKARAGQLGQSALTSLQGNLADRGLLGSGVEARGLVDTLAAATNPLSDINVAQLGQNIGIGQHALDLGAQQAAQQFQGGLTARGQDIGLLESQNQLAAQQAIAQQNRQQQMLQAALGGLSRISY